MVKVKEAIVKLFNFDEAIKFNPMRITNFYTKPFLKTLFYVLSVLGLSLLVIGFTPIQFMALPLHIGIGILFIIAALLLLTKDFFIRYDSKSDLIEIDRSSMFANSNDKHANYLGIIKYQIRDYKMIDRWYGSKLIITYEKLNGERFEHSIPVSLVTSRQVSIIKRDLSRIVSVNSDTNLFIGSSFRNPYTG